MTKAIYSIDSPQDKIAFEGLVRVVTPDWLGGTPFQDERVLENPTWGDLLHAADRQIVATGDEHHIFMEGAYVVPGEFSADDSRVQLVFLELGS